VSTEPRPGPNRPEPGPGRPPSLVAGVVLLGVAAILIIVVLVKPDMPQWLKVTIAIAAVLVVVALLIYAFRVFRGVSGRANR
jgi:peptidoglycan/LPS O-acetylase OafA/YrhL